MIASDHRSIYLPVVRGNLPEFFELFDFADPNSLVGQRDQTTVPSQSLFLMNSPTMIKFASDTADQLLAKTEMSDTQKLEWLYEVALSRKPTPAEETITRKYLVGDQGLISKSDKGSSEMEITRQAWLSVCQAVLVSSEFRHVK